MRTQNARLYKGLRLVLQPRVEGDTRPAVNLVFGTFDASSTKPTLWRVRVKNEALAQGLIDAVADEVAKLA
jgi:hypothetical protein